MSRETHIRCERVSESTMKIDGFIGDYLRGIISQWLLVAPKANPGMLEVADWKPGI
jgi:hypothetical protein